ncbi:O-antigen ligase family protein [Pseudalkalibacillus berkeleyi]|uniref:O-antigen ligase family protein n=1 Tax=Pseudalkalibacillus berkeleyi TaxID=1069813 RepID=A0ABS9H3S7_9BACL|nr:O-antigen ligase family protein [Pseudalkalibacillus berkeleyi]MCF6138731.1 O-antigen ligase family protein [Pseudalkalibacillus berkeleyi]
MNHVQEVPTIYFKLFQFVMVSSFIVFIEPSPYDMSIILLFVISIYMSYLYFSSYMQVAIIFLAIFTVSNLLSVFIAIDPVHSIKYTIITVFLMVTWVCVSGVLARFNRKGIDVLFNGYTIAAVLSVIIGLAGYLNVLPLEELVLMEGRVKSFFKDPNVFGPFLIAPALFALSKIETSKGSRSVSMWAIIFLLLLLGIILSFSRGAWVNFVLGAAVYLLFVKVNPKKRFVSFIFVSILSLILLIYLSTSSDLVGLFQERFGVQGYDTKRFDVQLAAISTGSDRPLGVGAGQTELLFNHSTHSLYIRLFLENGLLGLLTFIGFLFICMIRCVQKIFSTNGTDRVIFVIILASILGILLNSLFVDTIHWRHFWLLLALPWWNESIKLNPRSAVDIK